ncbi:MAG TPA: deaminase [Stellaceae bacterium]|nr:deaminase [Stellaceae bacterium]
MALNKCDRKWDRRYMALARQVSCWSKDPSTKVGAVIVDNQGRVVALGYNGFPRKVEDVEATNPSVNYVTRRRNGTQGNPASTRKRCHLFGVRGSKLAVRELKYEMIVHAEVNAVLIAGRSTVGGTIYVHGAPICPRCASVLIQSGIMRAVAKVPCPGADTKWDKDSFITLDMFQEAGITFEPIDTDQISN